MDIAFVYRGDGSGSPAAHPLHQSWAESVDADEIIVEVPSWIPSPLTSTSVGDFLYNTKIAPFDKHDVYVFESPASIYAAPMIHRLDSEAIKVDLETSWRLFGAEAYTFSHLPLGLDFLRSQDRRLDGFLLQKLLTQYFDGVVTVSKMMQNKLRQSLNIPIHISYPFIDEVLSQKLIQLTPELRTNIAVTVGTARDHKGVDRLVENWSEVRSVHSDAELVIIGSGHPARYKSVSGVTVAGYVESLIEWFPRFSLAIHPARIDAFPISTLETMLAGIPTLVTENTGTKEVVSNIDNQLITPSTSEGIVAGVSEYFDLAITERQKLSRDTQEAVSSYVEPERMSDFKRTLDELVDQITTDG